MIFSLRVRVCCRELKQRLSGCFISSPPPPALDPEGVLFAALLFVDLQELKLFATFQLLRFGLEDTKQDRKWFGDSVVLPSESLVVRSPSLLVAGDVYSFIQPIPCEQLPCPRSGPGSNTVKVGLAVEHVGDRIQVALMERGPSSPSSQQLSCSISCTYFWASQKMTLS